MKLLLDTHVLLWWILEPKKIGPMARAVLSDPKNDVFVSAATMWEIEIKKRAKRLTTPEEFDQQLAAENFFELPITNLHGRVAGSLPLHHSDPFDHALIAQAIVENLKFMTADKAIGRYEVPIINARK